MTKSNNKGGITNNKNLSFSKEGYIIIFVDKENQNRKGTKMSTITKEVALGKVEKISTVSDKIRKLNELGFARADIGRMLGKRYQHVRNVLEGDKIKKS